MVRASENPLKNVCENANRHAWWCTLGGVGTFAKEKVLELMLINLGEERKGFRCSPDIRMALGVEYCFDPLCFGSNIQVGCVPL